MGEKTEAPTHKRLSEAREKGQVPKSQDLGGVLLLLGSLVLLIIMAPMIGETLAAMLTRTLSGSLSAEPLSTDTLRVGSLLGSYGIAQIMVPVLAVTFVLAYLSQFVQVGWVVSGEPLQPKLDKLSPLKATLTSISKDTRFAEVPPSMLSEFTNVSGSEV